MEYLEYRNANYETWGDVKIVSNQMNYYLSDDIDPTVRVEPRDFDWLWGYGLTEDSNRYLVRQILRRKTLEKRQKQREIIHNPVSYVFFGCFSLLVIFMLYVGVTAISSKHQTYQSKAFLTSLY